MTDMPQMIALYNGMGGGRGGGHRSRGTVSRQRTQHYGT